jgi:hypothetical protein
MTQPDVREPIEDLVVDDDDVTHEDEDDSPDTNEGDEVPFDLGGGGGS